MKTIRKYKIAVLIFAAVLTVQTVSAAQKRNLKTRIKEIVTIKGIHGNPLTGIGLVVGLNGTGDKSKLSSQMITNILRRLNLTVDPSDLSTGSVAVVMVTAELGPFDTLGIKINVDVSTFQDASSLQGGTLLTTVLRGADSQPYALASGALFLGGFSASGAAASTTKNHTTSGRIPGGAHVVKEEIATYIENVGDDKFITLNLRNKDFSTAVNIKRAINEKFPGSAVAKNAGTIAVRLPDEMDEDDVPAFIDAIQLLRVEVDTPAIVLINEKTGTIIVGENVGISACGISQGSLIVKVKESAFVSQPQASFSNSGNTERIPDTSLSVIEEEGYLIPIDKVVTVSELAKALNSIGATPRDLIAIFMALDAGGYLQAELKMI